MASTETASTTAAAARRYPLGGKTSICDTYALVRMRIEGLLSAASAAKLQCLPTAMAALKKQHTPAPVAENPKVDQKNHLHEENKH